MSMRRYRIVKKLGDGAQGVAYLAIDTQTGKDVVLKKVPAGNKNADELRLLQSQQIKHPNIVACYDNFVENDFLYMVLSYAEGGDLDSYLQLLKEEGQELPLEKACQWFSQLASALQYCHDNKTLHRDVKPSNVFLDKGLDAIYLGDFGVAKRIGSGKEASTSTFVGSPVWLSPEVISGEPYSYASDAWGLGCVLYELVAGYSPFDTAGNLAALVMKIGAGEYEPLPNTVPEYVRRCVKGLLTVDTGRRWTIRQALNSCDEFRDAAYLVDVPAAPTPRGTYHPPYHQMGAKGAAGNTSASPSSPLGTSGVVVPSLAGMVPQQQQAAPARQAVAAPAPAAKGLGTWMRGMDDELADLQKALGGNSNNRNSNAAPPVGGPSSSSAASSSQPPTQPQPQLYNNNNAGRPVVNAPAAAKGLGTWMRGMDDELADMQKALGGGGNAASPSPAVAQQQQQTPQQQAPVRQAVAAPAPAAKGLGTWMRGMDDELADLQKALAPNRAPPVAPISGMPNAGRQPQPVVVTSPTATNSPPPPVVVSPQVKSPVVNNKPGLGTWVRGMDDDFASLQKQLNKFGGGGGAANPLVGVGERDAKVSPPPPAPLHRPSNVAAPTTSGGIGGGGGRIPAPSPTAAAARGGGGGGANPSNSGSYAASGVSSQQNTPRQGNINRGAGVGNNLNSNGSGDDVNKWVKAKHRQMADIESMLEALNKGAAVGGGGGGGGGGYRAAAAAAVSLSPPKSRDVTPQNYRYGAAAAAPANSNHHQNHAPSAHQQQQQQQPLTAAQERFKKAQAAAEAKQRKAEEDARARHEAEVKAKAEKEAAAVATAEKEARMQKERKEREENRSKALREFMQMKKEGKGGNNNNANANNGGDQLIVADKKGGVMLDCGGLGGVSPPPPVPLAGRRAVSGSLPSGSPLPAGGGGSARVLGSDQTPQGGQPYIAYGRRQSPGNLAVDASPFSAGGGGAVPTPLARPSSGPSVVSAGSAVPTPTAPPRGRPAPVAVASLQQKPLLGGAGAGLKSPPPPVAKRAPAEEDKTKAADERRQKLKEMRDGMREQMQRDRNANAAHSGNAYEVEIVLPGNLKNLPQNKI